MLTEIEEEVGERSELVAETVASLEILGTIGDFIQKLTADAFGSLGPAGIAVRDALHGVWLGHPLHSALTDVPVGAWTVTLALDAVETTTGRKDLAPGADASLVVGLVGAVGAALTGLTDYQHAEGRSRRIGAAHALLNIAGTACFIGSLLLRRAEAREAAKGVALAGYGIMMASAHLGGSLAYEEQLGVDFAAGVLESGYRPAMPAMMLNEGDRKQVVVDGVKVLLARHRGEVHALLDSCAHMGGPLSEGALENGTIRCPWHGSCFALEDGSVVEGPSTHSQPCYETRIRDGMIEVRQVQHGSPSAADAARPS